MDPKPDMRNDRIQRRIGLITELEGTNERHSSMQRTHKFVSHFSPFRTLARPTRAINVRGTIWATHRCSKMELTAWQRAAIARHSFHQVTGCRKVQLFQLAESPKGLCVPSRSPIEEN
jgi:hypothetical protein